MHLYGYRISDYWDYPEQRTVQLSEEVLSDTFAKAIDNSPSAFRICLRKRPSPGSYLTSGVGSMAQGYSRLTDSAAASLLYFFFNKLEKLGLNDISDKLLSVI